MSIGIWQVVLILVIVLIVFGAGKLPKVMGDVASGVKMFKKGMKDEDETPPRALGDEPVSPEMQMDRAKDEVAKS